jgi:hypothetical protein
VKLLLLTSVQGVSEKRSFYGDTASGHISAALFLTFDVWFASKVAKLHLSLRGQSRLVAFITDSGEGSLGDGISIRPSFALA